jgi:hypothetical protein
LSHQRPTALTRTKFCSLSGSISQDGAPVLHKWAWTFVELIGGAHGLWSVCGLTIFDEAVHDVDLFRQQKGAEADALVPSVRAGGVLNGLRIEVTRPDIRVPLGIRGLEFKAPDDLLLGAGRYAAAEGAKAAREDHARDPTEHHRSYFAVVAIWVSTASASASVNSCVLVEWQLGVTGYFRKPSDYAEFMKLGEVVRGLLNE